MEYTIRSKFFGKYLIQDSSGKNLFFLKRNILPFTWDKFKDSNNREIFSTREKGFLFFEKKYEIKKENSPYAKVFMESGFSIFAQIIQAIKDKGGDGVLIARIEKNSGGAIEIKARTFIVKIPGKIFGKECCQIDFVMGKEVIARAEKIMGFKQIKKLYDIEISENQEDDLILLGLIIIHIILMQQSRSSKR